LSLGYETKNKKQKQNKRKSKINKKSEKKTLFKQTTKGEKQQQPITTSPVQVLQKNKETKYKEKIK
jgi:hypothetical protein